MNDWSYIFLIQCFPVMLLFSIYFFVLTPYLQLDQTIQINTKLMSWKVNDPILDLPGNWTRYFLDSKIDVCLCTIIILKCRFCYVTSGISKCIGSVSESREIVWKGNYAVTLDTKKVLLSIIQTIKLILNQNVQFWFFGAFPVTLYFVFIDWCLNTNRPQCTQWTCTLWQNKVSKVSNKF